MLKTVVQLDGLAVLLGALLVKPVLGNMASLPASVLLSRPIELKTAVLSDVQALRREILPVPIVLGIVKALVASALLLMALHCLFVA